MPGHARSLWNRFGCFFPHLLCWSTQGVRLVGLVLASECGMGVTPNPAVAGHV